MNITENRTESAQEINYCFLPEQFSGFVIGFNNKGEEVYEWIDSPLTELSSVKLLKMLQMVKQHNVLTNNTLLINIKEELAKRNNDTRWHLPH